MSKKTKTASFGMSKREGHDSSAFYERNLYGNDNAAVPALNEIGVHLGSPGGEARNSHVGNSRSGNTAGKTDFGSETTQPQADRTHAGGRADQPQTDRTHEGGHADHPRADRAPLDRAHADLDTWTNRIYCHSSEDMVHIPDDSVGLAFTSPPYNVGKEYDEDTSLTEYLDLMTRVGREVYRVLRPGGRYVINIANLGRKPYIPLHAYFYARHMDIGFLPAGEIIWQKGKGMSGSCAWGSWMSARAPRLRDIHEYLLVFVKDDFRRPDKGVSDIDRDEFMESTLSIWEVAPESARKVGHPAPFPVALAERVIRLYSYVDDVILDPFNGSGSTCVAAMLNDRRYIGYDIEPQYCQLAENRLREAAASVTVQRSLFTPDESPS